MISCEKAQEICDKSQYKEASFWERMQLSYHLLVCKICKSYTSNNQQLTSLCDKAELKSLDHQAKEKMKKDIKNLKNDTKITI